MTINTTDMILDTLFQDAAFDDAGDLITEGAVDADQAIEDMTACPMSLEGQLARCVAIDAAQLPSAEALFHGMA